MSRLSRQHRLKNSRASRKGATLVLVAVLMTVIIMFAGLGIDFGRMYAFKSQIKLLADAAALSGVTDLKIGALEADARARSSALRLLNKVEGSGLATIASGDFEPGRWDFANSVFTATSWSAANAVRVSPSYTADWTLARVFGVTNRQLRESSVAALGSYVSSACLAPFAVPYIDLLGKLQNPQTDTSYVLQPGDIAGLGASRGSPITLVETKDSDLKSPGFFQLVNYGDGNGNRQDVSAALDDAMDGCRDGVVKAVGDWVDVVTGNGGWNSLTGKWAALCGGPLDVENACTRTIQVPLINGRRSTTGGGNTTGNGNGKPKDNGNGGSGGGTKVEFQIEYLGAIELTSISIKGSDVVIKGYFSLDKTGGGLGLSQFPGPVQGIALVK